MQGRALDSCNSGEWGMGQWWAVVCVVMNLVVIYYYNQQMHNYIITVFLCNLYCYIFMSSS